MIRYFLRLFKKDAFDYRRFERMRWSGEIVPCSPMRFQLLTRNRHKRIVVVE